MDRNPQLSYQIRIHREGHRTVSSHIRRINLLSSQIDRVCKCGRKAQSQQPFKLFATQPTLHFKLVQILKQTLLRVWLPYLTLPEFSYVGLLTLIKIISFFKSSEQLAHFRINNFFMSQSSEQAIISPRDLAFLWHRGS